MQVQIQTNGPEGGPKSLGTGEYHQKDGELETEVVLAEEKYYKVGTMTAKVEFLRTAGGKNVYKVKVSK